MSTALATTDKAMALLEQVVVQGDLSKLTSSDRVNYYRQVCDSVGLNPLTKPFEYIVLNGKMRLYALRDATDQLRKINGVSIKISARELAEDCYVVTAQATDKTGRSDEAIGAVAIGGLKGDARSNAMMKAETKAKRRVTLSICGMGWLDESEVDSIPGAQTHELAAIAPTTAEKIEAALKMHGVDKALVLKHAGAEHLDEINDDDCDKCIAWIAKRAKRPEAAT